MSDPKALVTRLYEAFKQKDAAKMAACYHPDIEFSDEVFVGLRGEEAAKMWQMLCERGKDLELTLVGVEAHADHAHANWEARYTFSGSGRKVLNKIQATLTIEGDRIRRHQDSFDFWRWSRQALGPAGLFLGFTPLLKNKVRGQARKGLDAFMREHPEKLIPPL